MNSTNYYTRMFPGLARRPSLPDSDVEKALIALGLKMAGREIAPQSDIPAGYTYLGQFIDHDLTFDLTPLREAQPDVARTVNLRTPLLDLDHVYGGGPDVSPHLYDRRSERNEERFLIGSTVDSDGKPVSPDDLPRNELGTALVGDSRQDENLILAQLHVAFLKFHNCVLASTGLLNDPPFCHAKSRFEAARRFVTWHYQWIVFNDFLRKFVDPVVFQSLRRKWWVGADADCFQIPVEFNNAAFRFGHSLVRDRYHFRRRGEFVDLAKFLEFTGSSELGMRKLPADWVVKWPFFFVLEGNFDPDTNRVEQIDTQIALSLHGLPPATIKLFNRGPSASGEKSHCDPFLQSLPVRTLLRGARIGLPSGQDVARMLGAPVLEGEPMLAGAHGSAILREQGWENDTPLWYYILREAGVPPVNGYYLGPVGSSIVADTIYAALRADPASYLSVMPFWEPAPPLAKPDHPFRFGDILAFIQRTQSAP